MAIVIDENTVELAEQLVAAGHFASADEAIRKAMYILADQIAKAEESALFDEGIRQAEAGDVTNIGADGERWLQDQFTYARQLKKAGRITPPHVRL